MIKGLSKDKIKKISQYKGEDKKTLDFRLKAYETFKKLPMPSFGPKLDIDFENINYYLEKDSNMTDSWE